MQNGRQSTDDKLDKALEDTFPSSDPVSISRPDARQGAPKQHSQTTAQSMKDAASAIKDSAQEKLGDTYEKVKDRAGKVTARAAKNLKEVDPDYLWLGGAFVVGCLVGLTAARGFSRPSYGTQLSRKVSDFKLQRKLSDLLDRLH